MYNSLWDTAARKDVEKPVGKRPVCLFILELFEDCPERKTPHEEICPFMLEPCSYEEQNCCRINHADRPHANG